MLNKKSIKKNKVFIFGNSGVQCNAQLQRIPSFDYVEIKTNYFELVPNSWYPDYCVVLCDILSRYHAEKIQSFVSKNLHRVKLFFVRKSILHYFPSIIECPQLLIVDNYLNDDIFFEGLQSVSFIELVLLVMAKLGYKYQYIYNYNIDCSTECPVRLRDGINKEYVEETFHGKIGDHVGSIVNNKRCFVKKILDSLGVSVFNCSKSLSFDEYLQCSMSYLIEKEKKEKYKNSINKRIIVFSVCHQVYPVIGGASARLWSLIKYFKKNGFVVVLVTDKHNSISKNAIHECVDFAYFLDEKNDIFDSKNCLTEYECTPFEESFFSRRRNFKFERLVKDVCEFHDVDILLTFYVWTAPIFNLISDGILKIIDTHDIQFSRFKKMIEFKQHIPGYELEPKQDEELMLLKKADCILTIQSEEEFTLKKLLPRKNILTVMHVPEIDAYKSSAKSKKILFVGNKFKPNEHGIKIFIENVFPKIIMNINDVELIICGKICECLANVASHNIILEGVVPDLSDYYRESAVVISPIFFGTGLKIKAIEAIVHGKCLVATEQGVLGLPGPIGNIATIVNIDDMANAIINLLLDISYRWKIEAKTIEYAHKYLNTTKEYDKLLNYIDLF